MTEHFNCGAKYIYIKSVTVLVRMRLRLRGPLSCGAPEPVPSYAFWLIHLWPNVVFVCNIINSAKRQKEL